MDKEFERDHSAAFCELDTVNTKPMTDVLLSIQRRGDKVHTKNAHLAHSDTISEEEENASGTEGEDSEVDLLADAHEASHTTDVIPRVLSPLASVSSGEASVLSSVGGASSSIVKLGPSDHVLMEDPDGMRLKIACKFC